MCSTARYPALVWRGASRGRKPDTSHASRSAGVNSLNLTVVLAAPGISSSTQKHTFINSCRCRSLNSCCALFDVWRCVFSQIKQPTRRQRMKLLFVTFLGICALFSASAGGWMSKAIAFASGLSWVNKLTGFCITSRTTRTARTSNLRTRNYYNDSGTC